MSLASVIDTKLSRRSLLKGSAAAAGAFSFGFAIPFSEEAQAQGAVPEVNAWVVIHPDDKVVIRIARSEMGQGTLTGLAQLVAEELDCDWAKVTTEYPTPGQNLARNRVWGNFSTGGSRGIRESHEYVRKGGAAARMMLVQAAADGWKVPAAECSALKGVITHKGSGRSIRYGEVAAAAVKLQPPSDIPLKDPKDWTIAGKPLKRLDTADKTTGKKIYGMDFKLPGMLNAAIKDCPVFGGKVKSFDAAKIKDMPGVKHVLPVGDSAVAVVADSWWRAKTALDALPITWDEGEHAKVSSESIAAWLKEGLDAPQAAVGNQNGDVKSAIANAARVIEQVYSYPFQNHACMEVMNATALYTPERCEVWTPTQNGEAALAATAEASGLPLAKCEAYKIDLGGGFGRRGAVHDWVRQVVAIAKQIPGMPVKLIWSREEDMLHGRFHPITQCKLTGALDKDGNLTGLHLRISGQSIVAGIFPQNIQNGRDPAVFQGLNPPGPEASIGYGVPNLLIDHAMRNPHVPPGFWRGVNLNQNTIYLECFIDELAHAAGKDPLEFRRALMKSHPKHLAVLNAVAEKAGWGTKAPDGVYRGICQTMGFGSYVAAVAEVSVAADGKLKIHKITAATDPGHAVNPAQIERQVEGSFVYGLSAALFGECTVKDGRMVEENFDTYPVVRMEDMPAVETIIVPSGGFWGGVGEPTIAVAAPAVLNAIFAATGKRVRNLPLKNTDLRKA
ncbi:Isoquinoline 1-oxidoreductase, beta subunit [Bosea sp. 62]|uniref:xanthine dehydrogenase family protein molybdopterin-binding subunit n=1 Tax=unclassified Bosea (in: a-proteobacteria) TaxID=2653178 RepID=UPI00125C80C0|nr:MULTISPECIES: molybdopterin cofactor-binding domain-containing protein [unclassified Bosea (in: a-proteobacteria)]CAD5252627.1 Isoquinoline 1-oxidoreductase, beta subunit [Bosea sp. 7B]CAD5278735.1 Isoquinoline 1-oxidoreductase, beta subunit [Bosea sp. 21B]CAD5279850.1 Isoquinoline 1-oxidoreductase, beta subunit [Bosea sp. 46]VVT59618.1 Isoquinoline 1-oxidoreductase, beta subunit [Bosea sp. EC-HK365B]VXB36429.1 Isoquinoline 1-oxidoreductase, beta subunit [Bosea sp. 62]